MVTDTFHLGNLGYFKKTAGKRALKLMLREWPFEPRVHVEHLVVWPGWKRQYERRLGASHQQWMKEEPTA